MGSLNILSNIEVLGEGIDDDSHVWTEICDSIGWSEGRKDLFSKPVAGIFLVGWLGVDGPSF